MGYRDDLISRLKEDGHWESLTTDRKKFIEDLGDEVACGMMAQMDEEEANHQMLMNDLSQPDSEQGVAAAIKIGEEGVQNLLEVFGGKLISSDKEKPRLTRLGMLLGRFLAAAEKRGYPALTAAHELGSINSHALVLLNMLYKKQRRDEREGPPPSD